MGHKMVTLCRVGGRACGRCVVLYNVGGNAITACAIMLAICDAENGHRFSHGDIVFYFNILLYPKLWSFG